MGVMVGYKQTEVGVIPEDWKVVSLSEGCTKIQDGTHFSPRSGGSEFLYITSKNIRFGFLDTSSATRIDRQQHEAIYRRCDVKKGDILLTKDGANTGNAALNILDEEISLLSSVAFLRFDPDDHDAQYLLQQILSSQGQRQIQDAMSGNAITRLTLEKINRLRIPVPTQVAEERNIGEALSDADALIESLEQLLAKKRQLKQGAMQELLTGKRRIAPPTQGMQRCQSLPYGAFPADWKVLLLSDVCAFVTKGSTPTTYGFHWQDDGILFLRSECVSQFGLDLQQSMFIGEDAHRSLRRSEVHDGDILMTITGNVGRVVMLPEGFGEANINQHIARIRVNREGVSRDFLFHFLSQPAVRHYYELITTGQAYPQISLKQVRATELPLPDLEEQIAIASTLSDLDEDIRNTEAKLSKARQLKQGMMQELLTGRIRLR